MLRLLPWLLFGQAVLCAESFRISQPFGGHVLQHKLGPEAGRPLPETMTGGVALLDYDGDQRLDVFLVGGSGPSHLYRNVGDGRFADVTEVSGLAALLGPGGQAAGQEATRPFPHPFTVAASAADFDGDGDVDLLVTGLHRNQLLANQGGRFADVSAAVGLPAAAFTVGAVWLDWNRDGALDLFLVNYVHWDPAQEPFCGDEKNQSFRTYCHPAKYAPRPNQLLQGGRDAAGRWRFTDVSVATQIHRFPGKGMGAALLDANQDGRFDLFVTNDTVPNALFLQQPDGTFLDAADTAGVSLSDDGRALSSMGVHARDFDGDGQEDLWYTALANESFPLLRNLGGTLFSDLTYPSKVGRATRAFSGWGCGLFDFDNDGRIDLFAANGDVQDNTELFANRPSRQANLLLRQTAAGSFSPEVVGRPGLHRGAAFGDLDLDGRVDIVVQQLGGAPLLLRNEAAQQGEAAGGGNWLAVRLGASAVPPAASRPVAEGAWVEALSAKGAVLANGRLSTAVGYASSSTPVVHLGLGKAVAASVRIVWPNGKKQVVPVAKQRAYLTVTAEP